MKKSLLFILLLVSTFVTSCYLFTSIDFDYEQFQTQRTEWEALGIKNYSFDYYSAGFFFYDLHIVVENNLIVAITPNQAYSELQEGRTISQLFQEVEDTYLYYENENLDSDYYLTAIDLTFDPTCAFITTCSYKYFQSPRIEVDGNFSWSVSNFQITP